MVSVWRLLRIGGTLVLVVAASGGVVYWLKTGGGQGPGTQGDGEVVRKREHYVRIQRMCISTVSNLLPALKDAVTSVLDTDGITTQLRSNPTNKLALWENLKLISFSRAVVSACVSGMLVVLVRVQLSVLGAFMYKDLQASRHAATVSADIQRQYLAITHTLLQKGLTLLAQVVRTATEQVLINHSLKHQLTLAQVQDLLNGILEQVSLSTGGHRSGRHTWLLQFVLPPDSPLERSSEDIATAFVGRGGGGMGNLLSATQDALEMEDMQVLLDSIVEHALVYLNRQMTDSYMSASQGQPSMPLARIIPLVCDHSVLLLDTNSHLKELVNTENLMTLSRNVYEAFSSD